MAIRLAPSVEACPATHPDTSRTSPVLLSHSCPTFLSLLIYLLSASLQRAGACRTVTVAHPPTTTTKDLQDMLGTAGELLKVPRLGHLDFLADNHVKLTQWKLMPVGHAFRLAAVLTETVSLVTKPPDPL